MKKRMKKIDIQKMIKKELLDIENWRPNFFLIAEKTSLSIETVKRNIFKMEYCDRIVLKVNILSDEDILNNHFDNINNLEKEILENDR